MYIFLVILAFGKKIRLVRLEPKPNRNTRFLKFLGTDMFLFSRNRISSKTEEPNRRTKCPPLLCTAAPPRAMKQLDSSPPVAGLKQMPPDGLSRALQLHSAMSAEDSSLLLIFFPACQLRGKESFKSTHDVMGPKTRVETTNTLSTTPHDTTHSSLAQDFASVL